MDRWFYPYADLGLTGRLGPWGAYGAHHDGVDTLAASERKSGKGGGDGDSDHTPPPRRSEGARERS